MVEEQCYLKDDFAGLPELLSAWREASPGMAALVLLAEADKARVAEIQAACRAAGVALAGAVFPALVADDGFRDRGAWLLRLPPMPPVFLLTGLTAGAGEVADNIAAAVSARPVEEAMPTLFLIFDGMLPNIGSILTGLYDVLGNRVAYAGVNAGSETFQPTPCLFDADRFVGEGVLGFLLPSGSRVVVGHGYPVTDSLMSATSGQGNRIDRIDDRPAFDVYRDVIRAELGIELTHANFYDYAAHYPFGLVTAIDVLVRIPVAFNEDGSLFCVGEVPPNAKLRLLRAPALSDSACTDTVAARLGGHGRGDTLLTFYCAGRRMHFGADAASEVVRLKQATGAVALVGALSLGEIDSMEELDFPRFHNATVVCVA